MTLNPSAAFLPTGRGFHVPGVPGLFTKPKNPHRPSVFSRILSIGFIRDLSLCLAILLSAMAPAWADWQTAKQAYDTGDYARAAKELKLLATNGDMKAQALLGLMCEFGRGVPRDPGQAFHWNKAAADKGNAEGELQLGTMYLNGWGVPTDPRVGLEYIELAAHQGLPEACFTLGMAYQGRRGIEPDLVKADTWLRVAKIRGNSMARKQLPQVEDRMTADQISEAEYWADEWQASLPAVPPAKGDNPPTASPANRH